MSVRCWEAERECLRVQPSLGKSLGKECHWVQPTLGKSSDRESALRSSLLLERAPTERERVPLGPAYPSKSSGKECNDIQPTLGQSSGKEWHGVQPTVGKSSFCPGCVSRTSWCFLRTSLTTWFRLGLLSLVFLLQFCHEEGMC